MVNQNSTRIKIMLSETNGLPFSEPPVLQLGSIATGTHAAMLQVA